MNLVLDITTSAEFWRQIYPIDRTPRLGEYAMPDSCACTLRDIRALTPNWMTPEFLAPIEGRINALCLNVDERRRSTHHAVYSWCDPIPEGSFYNLDGTVLVETPQFMFLSAASLLDGDQLIAFGFELCGLYGFDAKQERGFRKRKAPLTTISRLSQYLAGAKGCRGYNKALAALPHIVENSASPMETLDTMLLCLPYHRGGYCLKKPQLNYEIALDHHAQRIARREKCYLDMGYPEEHLDIEHQGELDHANPRDYDSDRARTNALKEMGFEVIELTNEQVRDVFVFECIAQRVAKATGKRIRKEHLGATDARIGLQKKIRAWNRSSGRLR